MNAKAEHDLKARARAARQAIETAEDERITQGALSDPDNPPLDEGFWSRAVSRQERRYVRIDADVLDRFEEAGPDWEERVNAVLRKAARLI